MQTVLSDLIIGTMGAAHSACCTGSLICLTVPQSLLLMNNETERALKYFGFASCST